MDKEHLNVAVVGTGPWGNQHLISFDRNRHTKLCAVVGRDEIKTREIAGRYNIRPYTDIREMYRSEKVDLVSICLNGMHNYLDTLYAIRQGVPLLIEKPLSFSLAEGERLLQEIERTHTLSRSTSCTDLANLCSMPIKRSKKQAGRSFDRPVEA